MPGKGDSPEEPGFDARLDAALDDVMDHIEEDSQQFEERMLQEVEEDAQLLRRYFQEPGEHDEERADGPGPPDEQNQPRNRVDGPCDEERADGPSPPEQKQPRKRLFLKDLTPNSKEVEIERRKQAKRDQSSQWHTKWASKGVPKQDGSEDVQQAELAQAGEPAQPVAPPVAPEAPAPAAPVEELDGFKVDPEILQKAIQNDMRSVRAQWMNQWMEWKKKHHDYDGDVEKLRKEAAEKWLKSELRAQLHATRSHKQF